MKLITIYPLKTYKGLTQKKWNSLAIQVTLEECITKLNSNDGFHERLNKNGIYKIFCDLDKFKTSIDTFHLIFREFMEDYYSIKIDNYSYTTSKFKEHSHHYSLPNISCNLNKLKEIMMNFMKVNQDIKIDTSVYSDHWFRLPNQHKESKIGTEHEIKRGTMRDFILEDIENTINISDIELTTEIEQIEEIKEIKENILDVPIISDLKSLHTFHTLTQFKKIKEIVSKSYKQERFEDYNKWTLFGMSLKNSFGENAYKFFLDTSKRSSKYKEEIYVRNKWDSFYESDIGLSLGTLIDYGKEDNLELTRSIINEHKSDIFEFKEYFIAQFIRYNYDNNFIFNDGKLYSFNGKFWETKDQNILYELINEVVYYDLLKIINLLVTNDDDDSNNKGKIRLKISKLRELTFRNNVVTFLKELCKNDYIKFNDNPYIFAFKNIVYDLKQHKFRDYKKEDYISINTGYDYIEPTQEKMDQMISFIESIFKDEKERQYMMETYASALNGICKEKFIVANGCGGNGKSKLNEQTSITFGNYSIRGSNSILFEKEKTGPNPEKANLDKKRFIVFSETPKNIPIENSILKQLTGGGDFSARGLYQTNTQISVVGLPVIEANKKPNFSESPTIGEARRLIDCVFKSKFIENPTDEQLKDGFSKLDERYKSKKFKEDHASAFFNILSEYYYSYDTDKCEMPLSIKENGLKYLNSSDMLYVWIEDTFEKTDNPNDHISLKEIHRLFIDSEYYKTMPKVDKKEYTLFKTFKENYINNNNSLPKFEERKKIDGIDVYGSIFYIKLNVECNISECF